MVVQWLASGAQLPRQEQAALDAPGVALFDCLGWSADFSASVDRPGAQPRWLRVHDGRASLVLPLWRTRRPAGPFKIAGVESLANYYTMRWQPMAVAGGRAADPAAIDAPMWRAAALALAGAGASVSLSPLDAAAAWVARLAEALSAQGCTLRRTPAFGNWVAHVRGARFEQWFAQRPAALRNTWRRRGRQLARQAPLSFELHGAPAGEGAALPLAGARSLDEAIAAFEAVYLKSWKQPEPHPAFVPALIRRAAARGALRLGLLNANSVPIAAQLWLRDGDASVIYKLAYDEDWKAFSPGLALSVEMFRHAIDVDRADLIDYGSGDDAYKRDWMDERRERIVLTAYPHRHPVGALLAARTRWRRRAGGADAAA